MLTLEQAQARLLADVSPIGVERCPLHHSHGRILAADLTALLRQPPFDASAMDGYAIRFDDLPGPWRLIGEAAAGRGFAGAVGAGETVRIFTGAPLPAGTDSVVVQEDTVHDDGHIRLTGDGPARRGAHVRKAGFDFDDGQSLLASGTYLTAARIGLAAAAGHADLPLYKRPRVALLSTGNELVPPGARPGPDQIINSNGVMLASLFTAAGATITDSGIVPDDRQAIEAAIEAMIGADLLVTVGGASVGDHDLVLPALEARGAEIDFWRVAIKPGKPIMAGRIGPTRLIGLPGNPVSAFVCAHLFILPLIRRLSGIADPLPRPVDARLTQPLGRNGTRQDHLRAVLRWRADGWTVTPAAIQDSSMLSTLAAANALIIRPPRADEAPVGAMVPVLALDNPADAT